MKLIIVLIIILLTIPNIFCSPAAKLTPAPIPTNIPAPALTTKQYVDAVTARLDILIEFIKIIEDLMINPQPDNQQWQDNIKEIAKSVNIIHNDFDNITPPADLSSVHLAIVGASGECSISVNLLSAGIDNNDNGLFNQSAIHLSACITQFGEAVSILREKVN